MPRDYKGTRIADLKKSGASLCLEGAIESSRYPVAKDLSWHPVLMGVSGNDIGSLERDI
jgi:hypothetical protein